MKTISPDSGSDCPVPSSNFDLLAEPVRRWVWTKKWTALRDIQERSIPSLLKGNDDLIIAAATAGGKTEAAFLPLISRTIEDGDEGSGFDLLYVSPLRALINDQFQRLQDLCDIVGLPVHPWHGDIPSSIKAKARKRPRGILLITPESLEATFVLRGLEVPALFGRVRCIVIDELHALLDTERGIHVRSLLTRLEVATRRRIRRVGLSATLGDMSLARQYLRPEAAETVSVVESTSEGAELQLLLRGYRVRRDSALQESRAHETNEQTCGRSTDTAIARNLFDKLRGKTNLLFAGSRQRVETFADLLRRSSEHQSLPNEFFPHHASLSREHRIFVERRLKESRLPTTAVCTSTLELGIDIGDIECVAQIGAPSSVASLRQRLGRSGRRSGQPAVLRMYETERDMDANTHPIDALRLRLVRSIAMVDLLLERWCERPRPEALHLSTLVHQILSVISERGGVGAPRLFYILCERGPFRRISKALFARLLRRIGDSEVALIEQSPDGTLLLGRVGERVVEHYSFYAVFNTPEEYRVLFGGRPLGTIPTVMPLVPDTTIIFSGRRWRIVAVHDRDKIVEVAKDATGRPPPFGGDLGIVDDPVVARMRSVLEAAGVPRYLDQEATELLREGRSTYRRLELARRHIVDLGENHHLLATWDGTIRTTTLALALRSHGFAVAVHDGFLDVEDRRPERDRLTSVIRTLAVEPGPDGADLASGMSALESEKFHRYLSRDLLILDVVASKMAPDAVPEMARRLLTES